MTSPNTGSSKEIKRISQFLDEVHSRLKKAIEGLDNHELNWRPSSRSNSIANLLKHIIGAEGFWIHHVIVGMKTTRVRASEFKVQQLQISNLRKELAHIMTTTQKVLTELTDQQLFETRTYKSLKTGRDQQTTVHWCLMHTIEHSALHIGQIFYIRKMYADLKQEE